jgi:hypothetical protein
MFSEKTDQFKVFCFTHILLARNHVFKAFLAS